MGTKALHVQNGGNGDIDTHEPPTDFLDPNRRLRRNNGLVMGTLSEFGMRSLDLYPFDPNRDDTGHDFRYTQQALGGLGMMSLDRTGASYNITS